MDLVAWAAVAGGCVLLLALVPIVHPGNGPLRTRILGGVGCGLLAAACFVYARAHTLSDLASLLTSYYHAAWTSKNTAMGMSGLGIASLCWWMWSLLPADQMTPRARRILGYWYAAGAVSVLVLSACAVLAQCCKAFKLLAACAALVALASLVVVPELQKRFLRVGPSSGKPSE